MKYAEGGRRLIFRRCLDTLDQTRLSLVQRPVRLIEVDVVHVDKHFWVEEAPAIAGEGLKGIAFVKVEIERLKRYY